MNPYLFLDQAIRDSAKTNRVPLIVCRSSYKPWLVVCRLSDLPALAAEVEEARRASVPPCDSREAL